MLNKKLNEKKKKVVEKKYKKLVGKKVNIVKYVLNLTDIIRDFKNFFICFENVENKRKEIRLQE